MKLKKVAVVALAMVAAGAAVTYAFWRAQGVPGLKLTCRDYVDVARTEWAQNTGVSTAMYLLLAPDCDDLLDYAKCFHLSDGYDCRYGLKYGPGLGGVDERGRSVTCSPDANDKPFPCGGLFGPNWPDPLPDPNTPEGQALSVELLKAIIAAPK